MTSVGHHPLVGELLRGAGVCEREAPSSGHCCERLASRSGTRDGTDTKAMEFTDRDRTRLYRTLEQLTLSSGDRPGATGSGLARTKRRVKMHGGTIDVESELDVATASPVRIPVA